MKKYEVLSGIKRTGVVAVIRAQSKEDCEKMIEAVGKGGIRAIEVTMTVPGAIDIISGLTAAHRDDGFLIGAGTVLDPETARQCILAGAQFIVSPALNIETVKLCNRYGVLAMPGIMTVTEAVTALEYGVEVLKVFPAGVLGMGVIKSFKGPLPQADFMPTGGVNVKNAGDWIKSGAVAIGTGGDLTKGAKTGDYALVTKTAREFVEQVAKARAEL